MSSTPIYLTDMSRFRPGSVLSQEQAQGRWRLIPYTTCAPDIPNGVMVGAASFVDAPEIRLPLNVSGWHEVSVGYWNPHFDYDDGSSTLRLKLSGDPAFIRIKEPKPQRDQESSLLCEAFFKAADLTGQDLVLAKVGGAFAHKAYIAYVKLAPLSGGQAKALETERRRVDARAVQSVIDGWSYMFTNEYKTGEHVLDLVERYRDSDVGKVIWAFNYGELTNYPTEVGKFIGDDPDVPIPTIPAENRSLAGEKVVPESLQALLAADSLPQKVVAEHVHGMGLKFDAMFRLAILGRIPPHRLPRFFVERRPGLRLVARDGVPLEKASYAFPEVRTFMLNIISEVLERFDVDGVNLCFIRGPAYMMYEEPVLAEFREEYGVDGREVDAEDPRMHAVRCKLLTPFVRQTRALVDRMAERKGRALTLSAVVYPDTQDNLSYGLDAMQWIEEGLLDSILVSAGSKPVDPGIVGKAQAHDCEYVHLCGWTSMNRGDWVADTLEGYGLQADGLGVWDMDAWQDDPLWWRMARRMGRRQDMEAFHKRRPELRKIKLTSLAGLDVSHGLGVPIYSGG